MLKFRHRVSGLYQPLSLTPYLEERSASLGPQAGGKSIRKNEEISSKSSRLLQDLGVVRQTGPGQFALLPLGMRSVNKLVKLIDDRLAEVNCQKLQLPYLTQGDLWKKTGRWNEMGPELFKLKDRHNRDNLLSPTHEEQITSLVGSMPTSSNLLSLRLYQIGTKFRDEMKPRFGLIRANEFLMKDLYTFDATLEDAKNTYNEVTEAYRKIFKDVGVPYLRVDGDTGVMGGSQSHEFHYAAGIGQDKLFLCRNCSAGFNAEVKTDLTDGFSQCSHCGKGPLHESKGIEVGHTFLLGEKYSKVLGANFLSDARKLTALQMGCYGIGVSRVLASAVEVLSTEHELRWPLTIAPFSVCILLPKGGSKESAAALSLAEQIYENFLSSGFLQHDDIIVDDREKLSVGKKLREAKKTGYPFIVLLGKKSTALDPVVELHVQSGVTDQKEANVKPETTSRMSEMSPTDLIQHLSTALSRL